MTLDDLDDLVARASGHLFYADESPHDEAEAIVEVVPALIAVARAVQHPTIGLIDNLCNGLGCGECLLCLNAALDAALARLPGPETA